MSYTNLLYHIVYATKERAPLITKTLRPRLHEYLGGTVRGLGGIALEINGTADHVHILAKLRPTISVSEFLSKLKSGSSGWAKRQTAGRFGWQARFGAFTVRRILIWLVTLGFLVWCARAVAQEPSSATQNAPPAPAVKLSVIVTDHAKHSVDDLKKDAIEVREDNVPQTLTLFSRDSRPVDYALVIGNTGSVRPLLPHMLDAAKFIINQNNAGDEIFIERFVSSDKVEKVQEFTSDKAKLIDGLDSLFIEDGQSAVIDGVYLAMKHVAEHRPGPERRHALVLLTDGDERYSYYTASQLVQLIRATDVQVFVIGIVDLLDDTPGFFLRSQKDAAERLLTTLAQQSGGRAFFPRNTKEIQKAVAEIVHDLHQQYIIGYQSTGNTSLDNFRNVTIKISEITGPAKLTAIARSGYFVNPPDLDSPGGDKKKKKKPE